jgi:hypothetical protein
LSLDVLSRAFQPVSAARDQSNVPAVTAKDERGGSADTC